MIPVSFSYAAPESLDEAVALLRENSEVKILGRRTKSSEQYEATVYDPFRAGRPAQYTNTSYHCASR